MEKKHRKRAITLAGGGPAAGLHIGALQALQDGNIDFQVWALSCIGAWVGIIYNQWTDASGKWGEDRTSWTDSEGKWLNVHGRPEAAEAGHDRARRTLNFFRQNIFREDHSYARFPLNSVFAPDLKANASAVWKFLTDTSTIDHLWLPEKALQAFNQSILFWSDTRNWWNKEPGKIGVKEGNINYWVLNQVLAVHPLSRFLTSLVYLAPVNGLSRIYYDDSTFLNSIKIGNLKRPKGKNDGKSKDELFIYHNAWDLAAQKIQLFSNIEADGYKDISAQSLCACSALPYIEETITIKDKPDEEGRAYCEGALVDTVNFANLIEDHRDLDEIWVSRIVDPSQVRTPANIKDAIGNLSMLFAGALGDDDVKLFKYHVRDEKWKGTIYELNYFSKGANNAADETPQVNFDWNWSNFDNGVTRGYRAATELLALYFCFENYLCGDRDVAYEHALKLISKDPLAEVARAITFCQHGKRDEARDAVKRLQESDRAWRIYPDRELRKTFYAEDRFEAIMDGLHAAAEK
jgi:predicted acylesterase/phospholipase RssA